MKQDTLFFGETPPVKPRVDRPVPLTGQTLMQRLQVNLAARGCIRSDVPFPEMGENWAIQPLIPWSNETRTESRCANENCHDEE